MEREVSVLRAELERLGVRGTAQPAADDAEVLWLSPEALRAALEVLASGELGTHWMLSDLFAFDDALGASDPHSGVTLVYALTRIEAPKRLRLKVRLEGASREIESAVPFFPNAEWLERELHATAGVSFIAHPNLAPLGSDPEASERHADELDLDVDLPLALALEALYGVTPPARADAMRVLSSELLRVAGHLFWYGAFADTVGAVAPAIYAAKDARRVLEVAHALGGAHPERFVVGGVAADLPRGWRSLIAPLLEEMKMRARDYDEMWLANGPLLSATKGVCPIEADDAVAWGITGPVLRSTGLAYDLRTAFPYAGYARYDFSVPTGFHGDLYDRARVRLLELRQSLRVLEAVVATLPEGPHVVDAPSGGLPPAGEAYAAIESSRGASSCFVASDGATLFVHSRTPSFAHLQALERMSRGFDERERSIIAGSIDLAAARAP